MFAGGIGEKGSSLRTKIVAKCNCLGFELDERLNGASMEDTVQDIGKEGARHHTLVCQTDEQVRKSAHTGKEIGELILASSKWQDNVQRT